MKTINKEIAVIIELEPCPFCGNKPSWGRGKLTGCQLHGEPMQTVSISCKKQECPVKPRMEEGDIYNGGEYEARKFAAKYWNRRSYSYTIKNLQAELAEREWNSINSAPLWDVLFVCRDKAKPHVTFEAIITQEQESWEIPEVYRVLQNMTKDEPIDGDWDEYEWQPLPKAAITKPTEE